MEIYKQDHSESADLNKVAYYPNIAWIHDFESEHCVSDHPLNE